VVGVWGVGPNPQTPNPKAPFPIPQSQIKKILKNIT